MSRTRSAAARVRDRFSLAANGRSVLLICLTALVTSVATAGAASLITGKDVKNNSLTGADLKSRSVPLGDLSRNTQNMIKNGLTQPTGLPGQTVSGSQGGNGQNGQNGQKGDRGETGPAGAQYVGANWGTVDRNTIGSPDIALRAGPIVAPGTGTSAPPFGSGSLGFLVANPSGATEKAVFGNQVDFAGDALSDLNQVGFRVFQTGENSSGGNNMPNITFEVDKNGGTLASGDYSTLVFVPAANSPSDQWSPYIDATDAAAGDWYYTGGVGTSTGCNQTTMCEFAVAKAALPTATTLTAQLQKGRDKAWQGAIDGFRINNEVFDFEQFGVVVRAP